MGKQPAQAPNIHQFIHTVPGNKYKNTIKLPGHERDVGLVGAGAWIHRRKLLKEISIKFLSASPLYNIILLYCKRTIAVKTQAKYLSKYSK